MPHCFRYSKLEKVHAINLCNALGIVLGSATNGIQIHRTMLLQGRKRLRSHAALANHHSNSEFLDDVGLVWLFAAARRRTRGIHRPSVTLFERDRPAMIQRATLEIDGRIMRQQVMMEIVPARVNLSTQEDNIPYLQTPYLVNGNRRREPDFTSCQRKSIVLCHLHDR